MSDNKDIAPGTIGRVMFDTVLVPPEGYETFVLGGLKVANKEEYIDAINRFTAKREVKGLEVYGQLVSGNNYPEGTNFLDFAIDAEKIAFRVISIDPDDKGGITASCQTMDTPVGKILQQQIELGASSFGIRALRDHSGKLEMMSFDIIDGISNAPVFKQSDLDSGANFAEMRKAIKNVEPEYRFHFTERGQPTVYVRAPSDKPVLTVANYCKWYELYLVNPDGSVTEVDSTVIHEVCDKIDGATWVDHIYSPQLFYGVAELLGAYYCSESAEVIVGRWLLENHSLSEVAEEYKLYNRIN